MKFLLGLILGILLVPVAVWYYLGHGNPPVAVADKPFPYEEQITHSALNKRVDHDVAGMPKPSVDPNEDTFVAGAHIYREQCAFCHGVYGDPSKIGGHEFPSAPGLWEKHPHGDVVGVSDDPPAETYWKVANGIRLTGMPAYKEVLSEKEMWQVSLLLANADKPLPPAALDLLRQPLHLDAVTLPKPGAIMSQPLPIPSQTPSSATPVTPSGPLPH